MNKRLIIIGAGGHGKVIADIALKNNQYDEICFLDDIKASKKCMDFDVIGKVNDVYSYLNDYDIFVAIGDSDIREKLIKDLKQQGAVIPTLVHPNAVIAKNVSIGLGTVVMAGAIINPDTSIGEGCIINTSASIDHDCVIKDYVHISVGAHLAGNILVNEHTWIGIGACVRNNTAISERVMIGAGAVVVNNIEEKGTYIGVPAKKINK